MVMSPNAIGARVQAPIAGRHSSAVKVDGLRAIAMPGVASWARMDLSGVNEATGRDGTRHRTQRVRTHGVLWFQPSARLADPKRACAAGVTRSPRAASAAVARVLLPSWLGQVHGLRYRCAFGGPRLEVPHGPAYGKKS